MNKIFFFILIFTGYLNAQNTFKINYGVVYDEVPNKSFTKPFSFYYIEEVICNQNESRHKRIMNDSVFVDKYGENVEQKKFEGIKLYKNQAQKFILSTSVPYCKGFILKDSTNLIEWKINSNKLVVLNYNCTEASGSFRGRNYKAYFTEEIPISNGPFKFQGLPGMILKIVSDDNVVKISAKSIEKIPDEKILNENVSIFIKDLKLINYEDAVNKMKLMREKLISDHTNANSSAQISGRNIEIFLNE